MILLNSETERPAFFKYLPPWKNIYFHREPDPGIREYAENTIEVSSPRLFYGEIIIQEDKELWEAWKELYTFALKSAEPGILGAYDLKLLSLGSDAAMRSFQPQNLSALIVNHAKKLNYGEQAAFTYAGGWMLLKKLSPLDWGKIRFSHGVSVFHKDRGQLSAYLKKFLECATEHPESSWIIIRDLSRSPVWRFGEEPQTERLIKMFKKFSSGLKEKVRGIYIVHQEGAADLLLQFGSSE